MVVQWGPDENRAIVDSLIRPAEPLTSVVYETEMELHLPFEGEWYVTAGELGDFFPKRPESVHRPHPLPRALPDSNHGFATSSAIPLTVGLR